MYYEIQINRLKERYCLNISGRKDFEDLMFNILNPLKNKYSKECALLDLGSTAACYSVNISQMEAFARPLWGLVPFWCGGGEDISFEKIYRKGIIAGTNPESKEYWGKCNSFDQRFVEMASLAYGLLFAPEKIWTPLTDKQKDSFARWLYQINEYFVPESNWLFFRVLVNVALKQCGMEYNSEKLLADLEKIESFYLGDGWYSDGISTKEIPHNGQKDYYISFAIHFYSLIYAIVMKNDDAVRAENFRKRAYSFAQEFIYWFSDSGEAVPYGRSLTYRFAQIAFWSMCLVADVKPFSVGIIKGIIVRNLEYWLSDNRIFDNGHIMTIGYRYNQLIMSEGYNSPGSPYWSMKAFAFMALPDEHEFWKCEPLPLPGLKQLTVQKIPELMVGRYQNSVTLYPAGTINVYPNEMIHKYLKFAYSTRFGFSMPRSNWRFGAAAPDSTLAFEFEERIYTRIKNMGFKLLTDRIVIKWSPGFGIDVKTEIIPTKTGHIRKHIVNSTINCIAYDSGFAVDNMDYSLLETNVENGMAYAKNINSYCLVCSNNGVAEVKVVAPNTNLISPKTVIPTIRYVIKKGENKFVTEIKEIL